MSGNRAIDPLPLQEFPSEADTQDPGFEQLFSDLVADAGTPADGFEDDLAIANSLLDSLDAALTTMSGQTGGTLDDTFVEILSVDPTPAGDDVANLSAALPDVQGNVDNLGTLLAGAALPAPPGAGGAGGGGAPASGCAVVNLGKVNQYTGGVFTHDVLPFTLQNQSAKTLNITAATWSVVLPNILSITPALPGKSIAPGASLSFDIVFTAAGDGPIDSTLTIQTDGPDPQPCIQVQAEIVPGSPSAPGTGPSGPQPAGLLIKS